MPARVYDPSLVNLARSKRYVAVSHDCSEHNAAVEERARARRSQKVARRKTIISERARVQRANLADALLAEFGGRAARRGRITQTKETCAPAEKLLKRALGPHVTAPGFHHDPRVMQARSMAAVERAKALAEIRGAR